MKSVKPERTELTSSLTKEHETSETQTRILVVDGHPDMRRGLIELISQEETGASCLDARSTEQAWAIVDKQKIDLVIVEVSPGRLEEVQLIEKIKLQCPAVPILILSVDNDAVDAGRTGQREVGGYIKKQEARDKILKAVRYVQSLVRTQVHGFTILVKV
ncbi:MAG: response regulator [Planctomycetota bacterium]|jgi:DNA-binding NarL/FixJ family response regulator